MRIVALIPGEVGDQFLFFPTLDGLKQIYPKAQIDVVVPLAAKAAYGINPIVHEAIAFDFQARNSLADWGNLLGNLREREYDLAIFSGSDWAVSFILWLAGIPVRVGFEQSAGANFYTHRVPKKENQYTAAAYYDLIRGLGAPHLCPEITVTLPVQDFEWADAERKRLGIGSGGYVAIYGTDEEAANGNSYPVEKWQGIIQDFQQKQPDLPLVLLGDKENINFVEVLSRLNPGLKVTTPPNLGKLTAMIAGANLLLCVQSTPMQLAVAVKTYTLALFGAAEPKRLLPESNRFVGIQSLSGQMSDIAPQTVLEKVWGG